MKPKIQIVNENDEIIAHKHRNEIDYSKDIYRSTTLWITNSKSEILLAQRKLTKDKDPGKWGPAVAGTVEEGETYNSNIRKETEEEIGLTNVELKSVEKFKAGHPRQQFIQVYSTKIDKQIEDFKIQEDEVERIAWMSKTELIKDLRDNPDKYVPAMPKLIDILDINRF